MPFVLENDVLKKTNEDLRKEQKNLNNKINEL